MATDPDRPDSATRTAKQALLVPLAVLGVMVLFIGLIATLLLFNTRTGALAFATVAAAGILFSVSLLASRDRLEGGQRFAAVGAGVLPLLLGGLIAAGVVGGVADEDRMVNVQPLQVTPEDAPLLAAQNSTSFCLPDEAGGCEDTDRWEFSPTAEEETVAYVFDNLEAGVPHNIAVAELAGSPDAPEKGADIVASEVVTGPVTDYFVSDVPLEDLPEEFYFYCEVHPNMNGVGTVVEGEGGEA